MNPHLLNVYQEEISNSTKGMMLAQINRTIDVLNTYGLITTDEQLISKTVQARWSKAQFESFNERLDQLIEDIDKQEKDGSEPLYYLNMVGFEVSDKIFNRQDNE